ncbi:L,D-transpeptidase family protein [Sphingomonas sp.]|jgi:lipoprotein-anchoring transpeptidase ErfK/SrfK|uniref:L,D-transpeptidase family protein n=1 Tax=Sphingomonas sp. TaxID=28214 RepID=UPI002ED8B0B4
MKAWAITLALFATSAAGSAHAADGDVGVTAAAAVAVPPNRFVWADNAGLEPVSVVVSVTDQRAYVYRGQTLIAVSSVSTGKEGKGTPAGTYPILQKKEDHKSNLYDAAPMPFMQRLTWDGIALHAGRNPGFPASHGCVRLPAAFAKKLFAITTVGTTVTVMDEPFVPGDDWVPEPAAMPDAETATTAKANSTQLASIGR